MSEIRTDRLLDGGDVNTQQIMMMIDKGIKKNLSQKTTDRARTARRVYSWIRGFRYLALVLLISISFLEKPEWCIINDKTNGNHWCIDKDNERKYPTSGVFYMPPLLTNLLEIFLLIIINLFTLLKGEYKKFSRHQ